MPGKLVILSGPSGAGKSTVAKHLRGIGKYNLAFSVSACSRKKREDEIEGKDYFFMSIDSFKSKIEENQFLEWEEVYPGTFYGTLKSEVEKLRSLGNNVIFDVDVMGAMNLKRKYKELALSLFIKPPSLETLEERLTIRNTETPENIKRRVRKANMELAYANKFDFQITNENLDSTLKEAETLVSNFLSS
jgi:guanylate kinase